MSFLTKKIARVTLSTCVAATLTTTLMPTASAAEDPTAMFNQFAAASSKMTQDSLARTRAMMAQLSNPAAMHAFATTSMTGSAPVKKVETPAVAHPTQHPRAASAKAGTKSAQTRRHVVKGIPKTWNGRGVPPKITVGPDHILRADDGSPIVPMIIRPRIDAPNHHWKTDLLSMFMAMHLGPVLHRAAGSWFNAPDVPRAAYAAEATGHALFGPGTPIYVGKDAMCTLAVAGYDKDGNKVGITAGHCGRPGDQVLSADSWPMGVAGYVVASSKVDDWAVIRFTDKAIVSRSYNGLTLDHLGSQAHTGDTVCKTGVATGTTCGPQFMSDNRVSLAQYCAMQGDSGAPVYRGHTLVGIVGSGVFAGVPLPCTTPLQGPLFAPTATHHLGVIRSEINALGGYGAGFMLPNPDGSDPHAARK